MPLSHLPCPFLLRKPQRKKDNRFLNIVVSWGEGAGETWWPKPVSPLLGRLTQGCYEFAQLWTTWEDALKNKIQNCHCLPIQNPSVYP